MKSITREVAVATSVFALGIGASEASAAPTRTAEAHKITMELGDRILKLSELPKGEPHAPKSVSERQPVVGNATIKTVTAHYDSQRSLVKGLEAITA